MPKLRSVDPATLLPNPDNPRRTPALPAMDEQLLASVQAIGIVQPPRVKEVDGSLVVVAGHRRVAAAVAAGLRRIDILLCDADEAQDAMRSVSENLVRASMTSVDIWRAIEALEAQGWNTQAIADALALPERTVRRLKLLARLHPPMLDCMAAGSMPHEHQLRTIAAASREEQAQVWKKNKPRRGEEPLWHEIARALSKRRIPFSAARFDEQAAKEYGLTWLEDLFAQAGEDARYTTDADAFFGAQQAWLSANLPRNGTLLPQDQHGRAELPRKAEPVYGKPREGDLVGHCLDHDGAVRTIAYRTPQPRRAANARGNGGSGQGTSGDAGTATEGYEDLPAPKARPEVTQKGLAMIGDLRTDALREALAEEEIPDASLIGLLVLAFAGHNVTVRHALGEGRSLGDIARVLHEGGVLTSDPETVRGAARAVLAQVLSCRENFGSSGPVARIAGEAFGASSRLPNMATEEFLSCLGRPALERVAREQGVRVESTGKLTRANLVAHFRAGTYVHPAALFALSEKEIAEVSSKRTWVPGAGDYADTGAPVPAGEPDGDIVAFGSEDGTDSVGLEEEQEDVLAMAAE